MRSALLLILFVDVTIISAYDVRLTGITVKDGDPYGRVEVFINNQWGTICDPGGTWTQQDAKVICRQLGFGNVEVIALSATRAFIGSNSLPVLRGGIGCSGTETNIEYCPYNTQWKTNSACTFSTSVAVICLAPTNGIPANSVPVRLKDGPNEREGRVEVKFAGRWGTVCSRGWGEYDAAVVCKQLGFGRKAQAVSNSALYYGKGEGITWLADVDCSSSAEEGELWRCSNSGLTKTSGCSHSSTDAGVKCLLDPCDESSPCLNGGTCQYNTATQQKSCICPPRTSGPTCSVITDPCGESSPCLNGGTCQYNTATQQKSCICPPRTSGPTCSVITDPCGESSPCLNGGTCQYNTATQQKSCICPPRTSGPTCSVITETDANVVSLYPSYGPQIGGTVVTIKGSNLLANGLTSIKIANMDITSLVKRSATMLIFATRVKREDMRIDEAQKVYLYWPNSGKTSDTGFTFTFKYNPIIEDLSPLVTILSGGVPITVSGQALNSVAQPIFNINTVYKGIQINQDSMPCKVISFTRMVCNTPKINIDQSIIDSIDTAGRRRRNIASHSIHKRTTIDANLQVNKTSQLDFYLGFTLDGLRIYDDLSEEFPDKSKIAVYINPEIYYFEEKNNMREFKPYWPFHESYIDILGLHLTSGLTKDLYRVTIGNATCSSLDVTTNRINCIPPTSMPSYSGYSHKEGAPAVTVHIGANENIVFGVGYLKYGSSLWDYMPARYGIVGGAAGLLVLSLLIIPICIMCCCRKDPDKKNKPRKSDTGGYSESS